MTELLQKLTCLVDFSSGQSVDESLKAKIQLYADDHSTEKSPLRQYLGILASHLIEVSEYLTQHKDDLTLSVSDRQLCAKSLQLLVGFGMAPCYERGVGVPLDKRLPQQVCLDKLLLAEKWTDEEKVLQLKESCECLHLMMNCEVFSRLIGSKFLSDILAGLVQLNFSQKMGLRSISNVSETEQQSIRSALTSMVKNSYKPALIRDILILQTGAVKSAPPPVWLRSQCGHLLSQCLLEPGGLMQMIAGILDFSSSGGNSVEKADSIAKIIATCPRQCTSQIDYYRSIGNQIEEQLKTSVVSNSATDVVICCCIRRLAKVSVPGLEENFLIQKLISSFLNLLKVPTGSEEVEKKLNSAINGLHLAFCAVPLGADNDLINSLLPVVETLLKMYVTVRNSTCYSLQPIKDLLRVYLSHLNHKEAAEMFLYFCKLGEIPGSTHLDSVVIFKIGDENGVTIEGTMEEPTDSTFDRIDGILDVLNSIGLTDADGIVTTLLIENLKNISMLSSSTSCSTSASTSQSSALLDIEIQLEKSSEVLISLTLLESVIERFSDTLVNQADVGSILDLCKAILESICLSSENTEMVSTLFGIVGTLILCFKQKIQSAYLSQYTQLRESMVQISQNHSTEAVRLIAKKFLDSADEVFCDDNIKAMQPAVKNRSPLAICLEELSDLTAPIKGHGLISLTRLVLSKDKETLQRLDEIIPLLTESLDDEDSYVFLNAVNCFAAVGQIRTKAVLPVLLDRFLGSESSSQSADFQLKVGEILTKMIFSFGEMAPLYTGRMLDVFLCLYGKTEDPEMKASCLANIGEVFKSNPIHASKNIGEILMCINYCLKFERADIVRRAAVQMVTKLMSGLTMASFETISDSLLELYRLLKVTYSDDKDEVVRLHAQMALVELKEFVHSNMTSGSSFSSLKL